jgi:hypothetical protein
LFDHSWRLLEDAPGRLEQAFETAVVGTRERPPDVHFDVVSDRDPLPLRPFSGGRPGRDRLQSSPVRVDGPRLEDGTHIVDRRVGLFSRPPGLLEESGDLLVTESLGAPSDFSQGQMLALELAYEAQTCEVSEAVSGARARLPGRREKLLLNVVTNGPDSKSG